MENGGLSFPHALEFYTALKRNGLHLYMNLRNNNIELKKKKARVQRNHTARLCSSKAQKSTTKQYAA